MLIETSLDEFKLLSQHHSQVIVVKELYADQFTPVDVFLRLQPMMKSPMFFETYPSENGRYSFLLFDPFFELKSHGHNVSITENDVQQQFVGHPFEFLRKFQTTQKIGTADQEMHGNLGGLVGYIAYDAVRLFENIPDQHKQQQDKPDVFLRSYSKCVCYDHLTHKMKILILQNKEVEPEIAFSEAQGKIKQIEEQLHQPHQTKNYTGQEITTTEFQTDLSDEVFAQKVEEAKSYIRAGDIFQIVLSRKFMSPLASDPFTIYRSVRMHNPSPYMFYLDCGDFQLAGSSPEKLISIEDGVIETKPLAGTRPIPKSKTEETAVLDELQSDEKENAEHMMLVDLSRNDLGAVSEIGSVQVTKLQDIERFPFVYHISSTVQGKLRQDKDVWDAIQATLPAGTLSGAPKIRAMQLIDDLETSKRGVYGGMICAISPNGDLDSCIAIRMAEISDGTVSVRTGAGIVLDSVPESEVAETKHKARGIVESISSAKDVA